MEVSKFSKPIKVKETLYERNVRYQRNALKKRIAALRTRGKVKRRRVATPKPKLGKIRKETEALAKLVAKKRDKWICQHCGKKVEGSNAHGSHIIPVSHGNSLRFDPMNILCLCYHCHINWWHKNPVEAGEWVKEKFPENILYINERKDRTVKYTYEQYQNMIIELKEQI